MKLLVTLLAVLLWEDPVPQPIDVPIVVRFPDSEHVTPLVPSPPSEDFNTLGEDELYVIDADVPCLVLWSSTSGGAVKVVEDAGPMKMRAQFVGERGVFETRTYDGKHLYTVEAVKDGLVELIVIPDGTTLEDGVVRKLIRVLMCQAPQPPPPNPTPLPPGPAPTPEPPGPDAYTGLRVIVVFNNDATNFTTPQRNALRSQDIRKWLDDNTENKEWRFWELSTLGDLSKAPKPLRDLWESSKSKVDLGRGPQLIIATDQKADVMDLPSGTTTREAVSEILEALKPYAKTK